jgi:multiple sugar transport system ATP-binding protein
MDIKLDSITKIFQAKDKAETVAVKDLDIVIPSGKLVGLLGPSGCGKSTTLYMIAGLLNPNEGRIYFGDEDVTDMAPEDRGIGLVFQNYALYPHMTVRQNIMFPLENIKVPKGEALQRAQEMADLVGIGELMDRKPKQLSGGQQQRVAIARALVKKPRVLLLDEPLSNLDARLRLQTREEIKRIQRETGITTIFVTHDQEEAMSISDQIVLMELGEEQQVGEPQHVYDYPDNLFVAKFLGTPPINIFDGTIENGNLFIGDSKIKKLKTDLNEVFVGIRPEGFVYVEKGVMDAEVWQVETIGRDTTLIIKDPTQIIAPLEESEQGDDGSGVKSIVEQKSYRVIVDSQHRIMPGDKVSFDIRPEKLFVFNKETGELV